MWDVGITPVWSSWYFYLPNQTTGMIRTPLPSIVVTHYCVWTGRLFWRNIGSMTGTGNRSDRKWGRWLQGGPAHHGVDGVLALHRRGGELGATEVVLRWSVFNQWETGIGIKWPITIQETTDRAVIPWIAAGILRFLELLTAAVILGNNQFIKIYSFFVFEAFW